MATTSTPSISQTQANNFQATDIEERDGFVEYCKLRTCERLAVDHVDGKYLLTACLANEQQKDSSEMLAHPFHLTLKNLISSETAAQF